MGVQTEDSVADFVAAALRCASAPRIPGGDVARLLPPLTVSDEEMAEGVRRMEKACARAGGAAPAAQAAAG